VGKHQLRDTDRPDDPDDDQRPVSPIEKMINALDEVQDAVNRVADESRTASRRAADDLAPEEPFTRQEPFAPRPPDRVPEL
jgi:hypothetical protein